MHAADRFLLLGTAGDPGCAAALDRLLDEGADWTNLLAAAQYNRVLVPLERPLLASRRVPGEVKAAVALQVENVRTDTERTKAGFERLLPEMLRHHQVVLLRGIANAYTIYRDEPRRPLGSDVDLLIDRPKTPSLSGRFLDHHPVPHDVEVLGPPRIECHHNLNVKSSWCVSLGGIETAEIWARQTRITIAGHEVGVLAAEDRLIYGALHNVIKGLVRLYRFVDLLDLVAAEAVDWNVVVERALRYRIERSVWINLRVLNMLRPGTVPASAVEQLEPGRKTRAIVERFFRIEMVLHDPTPLPEDWCGYRGRDGSATFGAAGLGGRGQTLRRLRKGLLQRLLLVRPTNAHKILMGPFNRVLFTMYAEAHRAPVLGYWMGRARARVQGR